MSSDMKKGFSSLSDLASSVPDEVEALESADRDQNIIKAEKEYDSGFVHKETYKKVVLSSKKEVSGERDLYIKFRVDYFLGLNKPEENRKNSEELVDEKLKTLKEIGIFVNGEKFTTLDSARDKLIFLKNKKKAISEKASDQQEISILCIERNMSYDELINSYQAEMDETNKLIHDLKKEFYPIEI